MKGLIENLIFNNDKVRFETVEIENKLKEEMGQNRGPLFYKELATHILLLEEEGKIVRLKNAQSYSRDTRIATKYQKQKFNNTNEEIKLQIHSSFHPQMEMKIYLENLEQFKKDELYLEKISEFLINKSDREPYLSVNERSFELFGNEKYLGSAAGLKILSMIGLRFEQLACYETYEPFFHFGLAIESTENILIVENKDTFFSLKKLFQEGITKWENKHFSMLIYGEGNKITKSINYLEELKVHSETSIFYFGDLDPEGISIYDRLNKGKEREVKIMHLFYTELWKRKKNSKIIGKEQKWNQTAIDNFLCNFDIQEQKEIRNYLIEKKYVPQEALNIELLRSLSDGFRKTV